MIEECKCECHKRTDMRHIMACCFTCQYCGKNIQRSAVRSHMRKHEQDQDQLNGKVR